MGKAENLAEGTSSFLGGFFEGIGNLVTWVVTHVGATELIVIGMIIGSLWLWLNQENLHKYFH